MLSQALAKSAAQRGNMSLQLGAPVGGINALSSIMGMPPTDSVVLENWIPYPDRIQIRQGAADHVTGSANTVFSLLSYSSPTGADKLFATTDSGVYDVTSPGAWPAAAIALTNGKTVGSVISTGASNYLTLVNGTDDAKQFDGAAWSSIAAFAPVNTNTLIYVETYRQRLFFIVKNSLNLVYLAANAVAGASTTYTFAAIFRRGGFLVALGTWTIDGGNGPDDNLVLVTSQGELAVFNGSDPATWTLKGVYYIGRPLGKKPLYKYGGDLLYLCENGLFPLAKALLSASIDRIQGISRKITPIFSEAGSAFFGNDGWEIHSLPDIPLLLVNVPSSPVRTQYCMHLETGAWSTFTGWDAFCFGRLTGVLYFGMTTKVAKVAAASDFGANIVATMLQAYSTLDVPRNKKIEQIRPIFEVNGSFTYTMGVASDFQAVGSTNIVPSGLGGSAALWGSAIWGTGVWTGSSSIDRSWRSVPDVYSTWKALYLQISTNTAMVQYLGCDVLAKAGSSF